MALVLFRSYVLLIVLCIFITLIDKSHGEINPEVLPNQESNVSKKNSDGSASSPYTGLNVSMDISERCELYFGINNQIKFPKNYKVHTFNVNSDSFPKDWLKETQDGPIIKLPEGYFVIVPKGFKIKLPKGETIPSNGFFDKTKGCKSHLQTGWTISPTTELKKMMREFSAINESKHGSPEGWIDIVLKGIKPRNKNHNFNDGDDKHGLEIAIEVAIPRCRIILPKKNTVVFPKGSRINFPKNRFGTPAPNWIERVEGGLIFNNLPPGSSVIIPDGYKVTAIEPCYGVPQKDWIKHIDGETIIELPVGWIIEPTKAFKNDDFVMAPNDEIEEFESNVIQAIEPEPLTKKVRCSAHTLNLCIEDGLKIRLLQNLIGRIRSVVKKIRTQKYTCIFKKMGLKYAISDVEKQWTFMYDMLQRLHEIKPFCIEYQDAMPDLKLSVNDWKALKDMIDSLQPARDEIIFLQKHDITMGDFFGCWWKIISKLKKKNTELSNSIAKSMEKRQKALFENPIFSSAKLINDLNTKVINHFRSQYPGVSIINILNDLESNILKNEKKNNPGVSITKIVNNFKKNNPGVSIQNELETIKKKMEDV